MTPTALKPGWQMTEDQHSLFWRLWSAAMRGQGWNTLPAAEQEAKRREVLASLGFRSAKLIDTRQGFDDVKKRFEALAGKVHNEAPDAGQHRRLLARIGEAFSDLDAASYPPRAVEKILRVRFKVIKGVRTIPDLETVEMENLARTLNARLTAWNHLRRLADILSAVLLRLALFSAWPLPSARTDPHTAGTASAIAMPGDCTAPADTLFARPDRSGALVHSG